jgi:hypothetical protein
LSDFIRIAQYEPVVSLGLGELEASFPEFPEIVLKTRLTNKTIRIKPKQPIFFGDFFSTTFIVISELAGILTLSPEFALTESSFDPQAEQYVEPPKFRNWHFGHFINPPDPITYPIRKELGIDRCPVANR